MHSLDAFAQEKLDALEARGLRRSLAETWREDGIWVERGGKRLLSFSCNDYLNLTQHAALKEAAKAAIDRYGVGAGASRLITGNHPLFAELEKKLAGTKRAEAAIVLGSGYLANAGIIPVLAGEKGLIVIDELAHACLFAGAQLSRGTTLKFRHNDVEHARALLAEHRAAHERALIVTDGVFSMDGDLAPVANLYALGEEYDAWLMTDDAHGIGVVGGGRGSSFMGNAHVPVPLQMGTLSKAIGGYGGYLCASAPVVELMRNRARSFVYSTGLPPSAVASAIAALDVIEREPAYAARPVQKARSFTARLGLPQAHSPIVPIVIGEADATMAASRLLLDEGFLVAPIRPPTVPEGTSRLRFAFTAQHPDDEIERLADLVRNKILA
jgi:8-amino-7-oxononanoate synthase